MLRSSITSAGVLLLGASAFAQSNAHSMLRPVTSTVKDAGVYHVGLGTWTRHTDTTNGVLNDVVYANTCPTGYYAGMLTKEYFADEGRVPGPNGPVLCDPGLLSTNKSCACSYNICGFQIAYCSGLAGFNNVNLNVGFQGAYTACALPAVLPKSPGTFDLTSLPGAGLSVQGCWLVTVDLDAISASFSLPADGASCTWTTSDLATNHLFGWTFQNQTTVTGVGNSYVGPLIAGNGGPFAPIPQCSMVDMTRWDSLTCVGQGGGPDKWPNNMTEDGWGMDTQDRFRDDTTNLTGGPLSPPSGPGCYFFGGNPVGSFHLKLFANTGCVTEPGVPLCRPSVVGGPVEDGWTCPCVNSPANGNQPTTPGAGCDALKISASNPARTGGALMTSSGIPKAGITDTLQINVVGLPMFANESAYLLTGTTKIAPLTFGQGLRCCAGTIKRLQIHSNLASGTSQWPLGTDFQPTIWQRLNQLNLGVGPNAGQTNCFFIQYRASNNLWTPNCTLPSTFNASQSESITWQTP